MKKRVFAIVPTVILCILLFYLIKPSQSPKSPYQNLTPVSGFSIQAVQAQYTIDTKQISLCITNHSDNSPELYLPYLEQNINETWVIVKKSPHIRDTDNLLYIPSGETMNVDFFLTDYDQLSVGKYRIIFGLAHSNDFFYFPFAISSMSLCRGQKDVFDFEMLACTKMVRDAASNTSQSRRKLDQILCTMHNHLLHNALLTPASCH